MHERDETAYLEPLNCKLFVPVKSFLIGVTQFVYPGTRSRLIWIDFDDPTDEERRWAKEQATGIPADSTHHSCRDIEASARCFEDASGACKSAPTS